MLLILIIHYAHDQGNILSQSPDKPVYAGNGTPLPVNTTYTRVQQPSTLEHLS